MKGTEGRPKILVVDDEPASVLSLMETLRGDYSVCSATDGTTALQMVEKGPFPDLILLDIMLPDMNGIEICQRLKADEKKRAIPVVFLSGEIDTQTESAGLRAGAVDYIRKPYNIDIVLARIKTHLELKRHREFLESLLEQRTMELRRTEAEYIRLYLRGEED